MDARKITKIAILAALYVAITVVLSPISYGPIQVRLSETLTLLPYFFGPWVALALWLGCMVANAFGGLGVIDVVFGSLITLVAGLITSRAPNIWLAAAPPIVLNAFGVAAILTYVLEVPYWPTVGYVGLGQGIAVGFVGIPLMSWLVDKVGKLLKR